VGNDHFEVRESDLGFSNEEVGAVFLLRDDGAALMQLRDDKPGLRHARMWVPPGGHREPGESMEACARREFLEETGYVCDELHFLTSLIDDHVGGWPAYQLTVFWVHYDSNQRVRCMEGQALKFIRRGEADTYDIPAYLIHIWDMALSAEKGNKLQNRLNML